MADVHCVIYWSKISLFLRSELSFPRLGNWGMVNIQGFFASKLKNLRICRGATKTSILLPKTVTRNWRFAMKNSSRELYGKYFLNGV